MRKLRAIRHPDILKFMDVTESDSTIFIMTERVKPLQTALRAMAFHGQREKEEWLIWGLHRISVRWRIFLQPSFHLILHFYRWHSRSSMNLRLLYTETYVSTQFLYLQLGNGSWAVLKF